VTDGVKVIMGLGNPGKQYQNSRHNAGYMAVATLAQVRNFNDPSRFGNNLITKGRIEGQSVILAWPQTYMNNSGQAAKDILAFYKVTSTNLLVVHDDMDIEIGRLKAAKGGGTGGGHNGVTSIINSIGRDFDRLKIGVSRPEKGEFGQDYAKYVLTSFEPDELEKIDEALALAAKAIALWSYKGIAASQRVANVRPSAHKVEPAPEKREAKAENLEIGEKKPETEDKGSGD
jgi:PTH1 family peptidyl-tRNA hydrolase